MFLVGLLDSVLPQRLAAKIPNFLRERLPARAKPKTT